MDNTNWTPGPWSVMNGGDIFGPLGGDSGDGVCSDENDGWQIAEVGYYASFVDGELTELGDYVRKANAALIAAAPDLYEALANIENDDGRIPKAIWNMRNKALAKARGEQQ